MKRKPNPFQPVDSTGGHKERAHSKFSASGSERWLNCSASVALEEASPPSKDSAWSLEGTLAHEVLEALLLRKPLPVSKDVTPDMIRFCEKAALKIRAIHKVYGGRLLVEKRLYNLFIHPEMFGTCDAVIVGADGTLHIIDFKFGVGHVVQAEKNTQLIQYALAAADAYFWDLQINTVKMWILQPRAGGKNWFKDWTITIEELETFWLPIWRKGVARVERGQTKPLAGSWCHWCRAKLTCPAKREGRLEKMKDLFNSQPLTIGDDNNGFEEKSNEEKESYENESEAVKELFEEKEDFY